LSFLVLHSSFFHLFAVLVFILSLLFLHSFLLLSLFFLYSFVVLLLIYLLRSSRSAVFFTRPGPSTPKRGK
jgi:hypothetical protein